MCLEPKTVHDRKTKLTTQVACRHCRLCRDNRVNDLVGRCIAESVTASRTVAVTLTYAGDGPETALLRYADVQVFLRKLRDAGYTVRYIVAGEYGSRKGRAHWHAVLFFYGSAPPITLESRYDWKFWPHGFAYFQQPDYKGFRYVLKYALKDQQDMGASRALSMSKKPPLGHDYFMRRADDLAAQGLALHSPEYSFADVLDRHGKPRKYWLQGRMRELFLERYIAAWRERYGTDPKPTEWFGEKHIYPDDWRERRSAKVHQAVQADLEADGYDPRYFEEPRQVAIATIPPDAVISAYHDGTAQIDYQGKIWHLGGASASVDAQLRLSGLPLFITQPASRWLKANKPDEAQMPKSLARAILRDARPSRRAL